MPKRTIGSNPSSNVPTPLRTTPPQGKITHSVSTCPTCQEQSSNRAPAEGRRSKMARDEMKLPIFNGNGTDDPEQYWFLWEAIWTARQTINDDVKKCQLATTLRGRALEWFMRFTWVLGEVLQKHWTRSEQGYLRNLRSWSLNLSTLPKIPFWHFRTICCQEPWAY